MRLKDVDIDKLIQEEISEFIKKSNYIELLDHLKKRSQINKVVVANIQNRLEEMYEEEKKSIASAPSTDRYQPTQKVLDTTKENLLDNLNSKEIYNIFVNQLSQHLKTSTHTLNVNDRDLLIERIENIKNFPINKSLLQESSTLLRRIENDKDWDKKQIKQEIEAIERKNPALYPKNRARSMSIYLSLGWGAAAIGSLVLIATLATTPFFLFLIPAFFSLSALFYVASAIKFHVDGKHLYRLKSDFGKLNSELNDLSKQISNEEKKLKQLEDDLFESEDMVPAARGIEPETSGIRIVTGKFFQPKKTATQTEEEVPKYGP